MYKSKPFAGYLGDGVHFYPPLYYIQSPNFHLWTANVETFRFTFCYPESTLSATFIWQNHVSFLFFL